MLFIVSIIFGYCAYRFCNVLENAKKEYDEKINDGWIDCGTYGSRA